MMLRFLPVVCVILAGLFPSPAADFSFDRLTLTVPDGFTVERVAGPPLVDRPMMADFDEQGRLYVADSSGSNAKVETQLEEKSHRVLRLEDTDGDGVFDSRIVFAAGMMFPEGVLWSRGSLYVSAPPVIWKLTDTNDDGICDERTVWHDGKTLTGCANDLHGPYLGPDGWIYWCKGAFAEQTYPRPQGSPFVSRASHIFRKHPDGGPVEPVMTGGMDNPVEVVFSPEGERFFTTTFLQHPGGGRRDGIIHAIYGGVYGKNHGVLEGHPRTGDLMPVMTHHGPSASCGLMRYESSVFGPAYQGNLFATLFNMRQVTRHELSPDGATYKTRDHAFLTGDDIDFHPTDVLEDADGSLLVIDTGGWYKLCCPTSQLPKPEVLGAIYRVRRTNAPRIEDPYGKSLDWDDPSPASLITRLDDPRPAVWKRALDLIALGGEVSPGDLESLSSTAARQRLLWALTRKQTPAARQALRQALNDPIPEIRHTALHGISVLRDHAAMALVVPLLQDPAPAVQRAAAETLGRIGDGSHVPALLQALEQPVDRVLEHSLRYALIEIRDEDILLKALDSDNVSHQANALSTLHELRSSKLEAARIAAFLQHPDPILRSRAWHVVAARPGWAADLSANLPGASKLPEEGLAALSRIAGEPGLQAYLAAQLHQAEDQAAALDIVQRAALSEIPPAWLDVFETLLATGKRAAVIEVLRRTGSVPDTILPALQRLALDTAMAPGERLEILALLVSPAFPVTETLPFLLDRLQPSCPLTERQAAVDILTQIPLQTAQQQALAACLESVGPMELVVLVPHFTEIVKKADESVSPVVLQALGRNPSLNSLPPTTLEQLLDAMPQQAVPAREAFEKTFPKASQTIRDEERLQTLLNSLPPGDVVRGQAVFNSSQTACVTCHAMGYLGGTLGPDLTRIGQIRSKRDLLESILFPSASFVRSYETLLVTTTDDQTLLGILRDEDGQSVTLRTGPESEATIKRELIQDVQPGTVSLMPPGLDTLLSGQQLADLLAFLENTK